MKTFQEYYKNFISTAQGRQKFEEICEELIESLSYGFDTTEYASSALNEVIHRLNTEEIPRSPDDILIGCTILDNEGDYIYRTMLYSEEKILSLPRIKPWDDITLSLDEIKKGELNFYGLNDIIVTARLSCYHMLPRCFVWDSESIDDVLGARVFPNGYGLDFLKRVLADILCVQIYDIPMEDFPLTFLDDETIPMPQRREEDCDFIDEDARDAYSVQIRRTQLQSFLHLYDALKAAKTELLKEKF